MAIYNAALQLIVTIAFIVIVRNPNVMNQDFITYMTNLFTITAKQFEKWIVSSGIFIFILTSAINVYDGFRKARIR
jgi:hypothetical protein